MPSERQNAVFRRHFPIPILFKQNRSVCYNCTFYRTRTPMFPDFSQTLSKDRHFLQSAFKNPNKYGGLSKIEEKYRKSHEIFLKRLAALPKPEFDNTLPVHEKLEEIKNRCRKSGNDYLRRNRFGQNHAVAQDLFGTRAWGGRIDRAYPAAPFGRAFGGGADCRRAEIRNRQRGRL